jgi:hypothetical protein
MKKIDKQFIKIPVAYLTENDAEIIDYDYMRILFEKQLDILFYLEK